MDAQARDELRAEVVEFACWITTGKRNHFVPEQLVLETRCRGRDGKSCQSAERRSWSLKKDSPGHSAGPSSRRKFSRSNFSAPLNPDCHGKRIILCRATLASSGNVAAAGTGSVRQPIPPRQVSKQDPV